ncbi:hypothetical protein [Lacrimispora algidixylanolytica]|nr:hypothetical protein [Lacrimispora algidixylanolytica]
MAHDVWIDGKHYVGSEGSMYVNTITPDEKSRLNWNDSK